MTDSVQIFSENVLSGFLRRSTLQKDLFLFRYLENNPISLTLPYAEEDYPHPRNIHPIFEMNLPEGALREALRLAFSKTVPAFEDFDLFHITGKSTLGRIQTASTIEIPETSLNDLLCYRGTESLFHSLLERYLVYSGISGVQPKVLLRDTEYKRFSYRGTTHIVKSFDPVRFPDLAANEYFCLQIAKEAGLPVPEFRLSENRSFLAVERFDLDSNGNYLGFEDFCVLNGIGTASKYRGSYEQLAKRITTYTNNPRTELESFFKLVALNCAVKNGDAHLKNFGVLYSQANDAVRLAPTYDIVSTVVYIKNDTLALTLNGTKRFPTDKTLREFGVAYCQLTPSKASEILELIKESQNRVVQQMKTQAKEDRSLRGLVKSMIEAWGR
jgi:serine/threonine-protein kinase HipA